MALLRIIIVSLLAAVAACAMASLVLFGTVNRESFFPVLFTTMGSLLLLAPGYAAAKEAAHPLWMRYARLVLFGTIAGALLLGLISDANPAKYGLVGAFYGATTAVCWIVIHFVTKRLA